VSAAPRTVAVLALPILLSALALASEPLSVTYLANAGFRLEGAGKSVLIDAFVEERYLKYAGLDGALRAALRAGEAPFANADLALTSHVHRDHFQASAALRVLAANPELVLATSPEVVAELSRAAGARGLGEHVRTVLPEPGQAETLELAGITVELLRMRHGGPRNGSVQHLVHVIHLGDATVLHLGDVDMSADAFAPFALAERTFDVALVPYWFFFTPVGEALVREHVRAAHVIAMHVPPEDVGALRAYLAERHPEVELASDQGATWVPGAPAEPVPLPPARRAR
jgi:L-ascorbate metabolism protein UlaG (beta-lactamase superfamily)